MKAFVFGLGGKMGQAIQQVADQNKKIKIVNDAAKADVFIDFSHIENLDKVLAMAAQKKKPLVIGTTGYSEKQFMKIRAAAEKNAVLWSGNMSMGIQIFLKMMESLKNLEGYDFQIEEIHHKRKIDSPSGTGQMLQSQAEKITKKKLPPIAAIRGGGVFGVHRLYILGEEETLQIEHQALNRLVFARGALQAAQKLANKKAGLYTLSQLI